MVGPSVFPNSQVLRMVGPTVFPDSQALTAVGPSVFPDSQVLRMVGFPVFPDSQIEKSGLEPPKGLFRPGFKSEKTSKYILNIP